jgi:hypothetical protein
MFSEGATAYPRSLDHLRYLRMRRLQPVNSALQSALAARLPE